ncbi:hypothetical protein FALCPG4_016508 [Fusarium falciforme]
MAFKQATAVPFGNILAMCLESRDSSRLRGVNYFVGRDGSLQTYEYADLGVTDMTKYSVFVDEFCSLIAKRGLQRNFGLKLQTDWEVPFRAEFEFPCEHSTMIIPRGLPVPDGTDGVDVTTQWGAEGEMGVPTEG